MLELSSDATAHVVVEHTPIFEKEHELTGRCASSRLMHGRNRFEELVVDLATADVTARRLTSSASVANVTTAFALTTRTLALATPCAL